MLSISSPRFTAIKESGKNGIWYTLILVASEMTLRFHTFLLSQPKAALAFTNLVFTLSSMTIDVERVLPMSVNFFITFSRCPLMIMLGSSRICSKQHIAFLCSSHLTFSQSISLMLIWSNDTVIWRLQLFLIHDLLTLGLKYSYQIQITFKKFYSFKYPFPFINNNDNNNYHYYLLTIIYFHLTIFIN